MLCFFFCICVLFVSLGSEPTVYLIFTLGTPSFHYLGYIRYVRIFFAARLKITSIGSTSITDVFVNDVVYLQNSLHPKFHLVAKKGFEVMSC